MKKLIALLLISLISICHLYSQNKTSEGRVIDNNLETLPGVPIFISDTIQIGETDLEGFFKIEIPTDKHKITFKYLGIDPATIELIEQCEQIEVIMMLTGTHDFETFRRAERERKKKFKLLPEIHKRAYNKGIFQLDEPCYNREFEPYFLEKEI
ncbi:carboxypeptidase-like regulatory domain-containing protein [Gramella lutea]|uniref:Carboxypeptidase-like regulatory domain-containing protein n=1 Tax=Christiangramia lutea TaxID=1607951 RepID=A0A9X2ABX9_9FLAO|nr:carboxypeptidase-like regulatory domain-containing protein [Christiangramia lutea]MCH4824636.1 carboxypeptidase-like regulatory domain-containing protein [Christiangramia lutea]